MRRVTGILGGLVALTVAAALAVAAAVNAGDSAPTPGASGAGQPTPSFSPPANPADLLLPAARAIEGKSLRFRLSSPTDRAEGSYDPASGGASLRQSQDGKQVEVVTAGAQLYLIGYTPDGTVMRVDIARLPDTHGLVPLADPLVAVRLLTGVTEIAPNEDGYAGKIDLTKVDPGPSPASRRIVARFLGAAAERATAVPFTVELDTERRLKTFRATFPKAEQGGKDLVYEFTVIEIGIPVAVATPTGPQVIDAPSEVYAP